jgi:hypothetical protein
MQGERGVRKPIRLTAHASGYTERRGFTADEVERAIRQGVREAARDGRFERSLDFGFGSAWNGRHYTTKRVRAIFADEESEIVVITVYTYFFKAGHAQCA